MTIGIEDFRTAEDLRIDRMLVQPFRLSSSRPQADTTASDPDHDMH